MNRISITFKISVSLACLLVSILLAAYTIGFLPDEDRTRIQSQLNLCETIAIQTSMAIRHSQPELMQDSLRATVQGNPDITYALISRGTNVIGRFTDDEQPFNDARRDISTVVRVPIVSNNEPWGEVELGLKRHAVTSGMPLLSNPLLRLTLFCGCLAIPAYFVYLRRVLQHLDPSEVVPDRVRKTLDTLAEGLVVLDREQRIVLANNALAIMLDSTPDELIARNITGFSWLFEDEELFDEELPWTIAMSQRRIVAGQVLQLTNAAGQRRTLRINASPIEGTNHTCEGVLISFDDVTLLEERNTALTSMLDKLRDSRDQIQRQNRELTVLATRDPLTGALNRRCFFEEFERQWDSALKNQSAISCIMIDVDHFKSINDNHGHAEGDFVLREVVRIVEATIGKKDILSRYGGEEFCVLCPGKAIDDAIHLADRIREEIAARKLRHDETVTASLGVSAVEFGAESPNDMLNEADSALYHSKRTGRNRTTSWGDIRENTVVLQKPDSRDGHISIDAVNALLYALGNRDAATVEHCKRVAALCHDVSTDLFTESERHLLKNAALLHDFGKICAPDSILHKEEPLSESEASQVQSHNMIGVDIVRATFGRDDLADLIQQHHSGQKKISLPARLLSIVDAFDTMTTDHSHQRKMSKTAAIDELKKLAGTRFDPTLVKHFVGFLTGDVNQPAAPEPGTKLPLEKQLEMLARVLDDRDVPAAVAITQDILVASRQLNSPEIVELAEVLSETTKHDSQWIESVRITVQLMDLCRIVRQERKLQKGNEKRNSDQPVAAGA